MPLFVPVAGATGERTGVSEREKEMSTDEKARKTILLIDDDTSLLVTLSDFLKFEGYDVVTADSGERGLKVLATVSPDLIILDMSMPGMGGIGFLEEITVKGRPTHPVLVLTARATMAEFFAHTQVDGFVAKPCDPSDLLLEVGRIIFLRSGESEDAESIEVGQNLRALLGEDRRQHSAEICAQMEAAGYSVECVFAGPDVLEAAIVGQPDVVILRLQLEGMAAPSVVDVLSQMPNTQGIPVVIYGVDEPGVDLELQSALDEQRVAAAVSSASPAEIVSMIASLVVVE